jgi:outer membrane receptor protein involved in Fe transport
MKLLLTGVKSAIDAECVGASRPSRRRRLDARRGFARLSRGALNGYGGANCNYRFNGPGVGAVAGQDVVNITDPLQGNTTFRTVTTVGNPDLQPQTAKVRNFGATWLPVSRASLSLDWWTFKYDNQIAIENGQAVINANPNGSQVIRDQSGAAQTVLVRSYNAKSGAQTSGLDLDGDLRLRLGLQHLHPAREPQLSAEVRHRHGHGRL